MLCKRVIPCLDVDGGRVKKGVRFKELRDAGDPVAVAAAYDAQGADEVCFLDITASSDGRNTMVDVGQTHYHNLLLTFGQAMGYGDLKSFGAQGKTPIGAILA